MRSLKNVKSLKSLGIWIAATALPIAAFAIASAAQFRAWAGDPKEAYCATDECLTYPCTPSGGYGWICWQSSSTNCKLDEDGEVSCAHEYQECGTLVRVSLISGQCTYGDPFIWGDCGTHFRVTGNYDECEPKK
jgi:hypothetical protein